MVESAREGAAPGETAYRDFWDEVGDGFPDLGGAASTAYYRDCEERLLAEHLPEMAGLRIFKTDLWDEVKNTRILQWVAGRGAAAYGIDIATPIAVRAAAGFARADLRLRAAVSDTRAIPFADGSFDAVYSMGTIEHFDETAQAVREIGRVLKPGGRALIGVPNRHDPFLRPLVVWVLYRLGLYGYGFEKSYTRRQLRALCEEAGLRVVGETGILFIPGKLRMLDLLCWTRWRRLSRITAIAVRPFAWLYRRFPRLRRHGYLIVSVTERPAA